MVDGNGVVLGNTGSNPGKGSVLSVTKDARKPVIADVAKLAGVSIPTVSRVLTGNIPVSPEKRERVLAAIEQLNYRPSSMARALRSGERKMIAILAASTERYGYAQTIAGMEQAAQAAGYSVVISTVRSHDEEDVEAALKPALEQQVTGVLVIDFDPSGSELLRRMPEGIPAVAASGFAEGHPGFPYAFIDEYSAGRQATEHLLSLGHRTVHHLGLFPLTQFSGRYEGWRDSLLDAGIEPPPVLPAQRSGKSGYEQGIKIAGDRRITAVFCSNDGLALAAMRALHERGVRVPEDVSLVGWDNQPFTEYTMPSLTTVEPGFSDLGRSAFSLLVRQMGGEPNVQNSVNTPRMIMRESTAPSSRAVEPAAAARNAE
jgi:DNA-binding LacI/PurR family transcriptional regulator